MIAKAQNCAQKTSAPIVSKCSLPTDVPHAEEPSQKVNQPPHLQVGELAIHSRWLPVKKMAQYYQDVISEQALRSLIWEAEAYEKHPKSGLKSNGFLPVIVRPPNQRKVLLDRVEFEKWLTSRQRISRN